MASQEPWDIGAALPVSCTASGAAERDLFTDRECNHTHTHTDNGPPSLHFSPTAMSESVSQCVSVVVFFFFFPLHLHKYGSLWWEARATVPLMVRGSGVGCGVVERVWVEGELRTSYARQPVFCVFSACSCAHPPSVCSPYNSVCVEKS